MFRTGGLVEGSSRQFDSEAAHSSALRLTNLLANVTIKLALLFALVPKWRNWQTR